MPTLKVMDYAGYEGLYVPEQPVLRAYEEEGKHEPLISCAAP